MSIDNFKGKYAYLSNFWNCEVEYEGDLYPSSEHAFVAAKTTDNNIRKKIISIDTPSKVKAFGRKIKLREDWEDVKIEEMYIIVKNKFERNPELLKKLIDTGGTLLVEGNTWKDTFWGQCPIGNGQNHLGKILMRVREELKEENEKCDAACSCDTDTDFDPSDLIKKCIDDARKCNQYETSINIIDTSYRYGFHCQKHPSMLKTILRITRETPLNAMQIYISSPKSKFPPKFDYDDLLAARNEIIRSGIDVVIHGCLLYNLAGTVKGIADANYHQALASTLQGLIAELDFGVMLGAIGVVVHPGARDKKFDKPTSGLQCISKSIETALTRKTDESEKIAKILGITQAEVIKRRKIILENAAGEGNKCCSTLEEINEVIIGVDKKLRGQVMVCVDTQHSYARGLFDWGLKGEIDRFYKEFDEIIGLKYLQVLHFNDSMESDKKASNAPFGGRKDRHQQLSEGYVFSGERIGCIIDFMLKAREKNIIVIGEPPVSGMNDWILVCSLLENTEYPLVKVITAS
jgi:ribA/ribD-fused uncharacterized protein